MMTNRLIVACLAALPALAQQNSGPFVPGAIYVVNSATRRTAQTQGNGFAPGSLCDINILGLYQPSGTLARDDKVTLRFRAPGATDARDIAILATQSFGGFPVQFTALIPAGTPLGQAEVLAVSDSGQSFSSTVWIGDPSFGIFTRAAAGYDAALAQVLRDIPRTVGLTTPVRTGEWVTLWGTGLGSTNRSPASTVLVDVAGIGVVPSYAGPAPGLPGVDQINFQFPAGVPDDCYIPLAVKVDARAGNTTSIATASAPGACPHRLGLSSDSLATLDQGGQVPVSQSWVHADVLPAPGAPVTYRRYDTVSLTFVQYDSAGVQVVTGLLAPPVSGCQLNLDNGTVGAILNAPPFDAGTPVVTGPGGVRIPMDGSFGFYSTAPSDTSYTLDGLPPSSYAPGDWAVEVPGGKNVAAFHAALRIPPALRWMNRATVSPVSRVSDLTLKWDAAGYTDREWMQGSVGAGTGAVICQSPATAGSIAIPASLIAQLPPVTGIAPMVELLLTPTRSNPVVYTVPLIGGGAFPGVSTFSYLEAVSVELK